MSNLINNFSGIPFAEINLQDALNQLKNDIETAILNGGEKSKNALIKTQKPIKLIHDVIKTDLVNEGIHLSLINPSSSHINRLLNPPKREYKGNYKLKQSEQKLAGFLKTKDQDISVIPNNITFQPETLSFPTMLNGYEDRYGEKLTESILTINVRSQLSSTDKNFDTLYERTFAEPLNFHLRCPKMVLGEIYLILVKEYDSDEAKNNKVSYKFADSIEKYIKAFQAINDRKSEKDDLWKYERTCLLIVDFSKSIPTIYNSVSDLQKDGFISASSLVDMSTLSYSNFISDLMQIYKTRFPTNTFS